MRRTPFALAALLLVLAPGLARAEEPAPAPAPAPASPADAAKKVRAAFPEPSEKAAFAVEVEVFVGGQVVGTATFSAAADTALDAKVWRLKSKFAQGPADAPLAVTTASSTLERTLRLLHEEKVAKQGEKQKTTMAVRSEKGFDVGFTEGEKETVKTVAEAPDDATTDEIAGLLLFLRMCPADPATYEVTTYDTDERQTRTRKVDVKGAGRLKEESLGLDAEAFVAVLSAGKEVTELFLDPKDRSFLAVHSVDRGFWGARKGLGKVKDAGPVPDYKQPAKSAKEAGIRLAMGISTGDLEVLEGTFHWESVPEMFKAMGLEIDDPETAKMMLIEGMKPYLKEMEPAKAWPGVKSLIDSAAETKSEDGTVEVKPSGGMPSYKAKEFDGKWLITWMAIGGR
jgi:hypothetical protein